MADLIETTGAEDPVNESGPSNQSRDSAGAPAAEPEVQNEEPGFWGGEEPQTTEEPGQMGFDDFGAPQPETFEEQPGDVFAQEAFDDGLDDEERELL